MKTSSLVPACVFLLLAIAGCAARSIVVAPLKAALEHKDTAISGAAERIGENNAAAPESPQKPLIAADVVVIKDALATLPAAEVAKALASLAAERDAARKDALLWKSKYTDAESGVWRKVQFWLALGLYAGAVACLVLAGVRVQAAISTGVPTLQGIKGIVGLVSMASSLYTLARFLAAWWFPWAMGAVGLVTLGWLAYTVWRARHLETKAAAFTAVRKQLDAAYETAAPEAAKALDDLVFHPLSTAMEKIPGAKTAIHLDRAKAPSAS